MKKILVYFCVFFIGSLLPFLIVEYYFQDYITFGIILSLASIILIVCLSVEFLQERVILILNVRNENIDSIKRTQKKEEAAREFAYYFRNRL